VKLYIVGDMIHRHRQHDGEYFPKIEIIGGTRLKLKVNVTDITLDFDWLRFNELL
jgi:hypothetical protein